jgi:hypothetical protein
MVCGSHVRELKPHPEGIYFILKNYKETKSETAR